MNENEKKKGDIIITLWISFGVMFILGFFLFSMIIGGSAGNGYQDAGRFFVGEHGIYVEVSKTIWTISRVWGILFSIMIPLTPIGAFVISDIQEKLNQRKNRFE